MGSETDFLGGGARRKGDVVAWRLFVTLAFGALGYGQFAPKQGGGEWQQVSRDLAALQQQIAVLSAQMVFRADEQERKINDHEARLRDLLNKKGQL